MASRLEYGPQPPCSVIKCLISLGRELWDHELPLLLANENHAHYPSSSSAENVLMLFAQVSATPKVE